jgi:hypothetical protein
MAAGLDTVGERLSIESALPWVMEILAEGAAGDLDARPDDDASVRVVIESERRGFDTRGWELLTRGVWRREGALILENACTAGFDLHLSCTPAEAVFTFRWRPPRRDRAAARVLRSRFHLLVRALMIQYPALWWAGRRMRVPLHASACTVGEHVPMLAAASGVGRSTLLLQELEAGGTATGDNIAVADGTTVWGLVEPLRVEGAGGRRMPHGRQETPMRDRAPSLVPDRVVVLERGTGDGPSLQPCTPELAARSLVTSTYMAGELRRYWSFAATLSAGTGFGPAHPPVADVASLMASALPCYTLALGQRPGVTLSDLLNVVEISA